MEQLSNKVNEQKQLESPGFYFFLRFSTPSLICQLHDKQPNLLFPPHLSYRTSEPDWWWQTTLQLGDSLLASRCHLLLPKVPWHKEQSNACASTTDRHHPRQRNTTVSSGREQEWLQAAECLALSRSRVQPSHPLLPSQLPTFSPFNTHSFSTRPLNDEKFPARGHGSNGLLKRNAIPYSRRTSSFFSPWGGRIIVQPGRKKKKKKPSPKPVVIILNKRPKGFGQENPKFKRIITPRDLSLKLSH